MPAAALSSSPTDTSRLDFGSEPRRLVVALTVAGGLLGLGVPAAASGASLTLTVNPAEAVAGRPTEFRFDTQHDAASYLYAYSQSVGFPVRGSRACTTVTRSSSRTT